MVTVIDPAAGSIIIARLIGASEYGLYGLSLVVPAFMVMFVTLGLNPAVVRFTSASIAKRETPAAANYPSANYSGSKLQT